MTQHHSSYYLLFSMALLNIKTDIEPRLDRDRFLRAPGNEVEFV